MTRHISLLLTAIPSALLITALLALSVAGSPGDAPRREAEKLEAKSQFVRAIRKYRKAYALDRAAQPRQAVADLNCIALLDKRLNSYGPAAQELNQALLIAVAVRDRLGEARTRTNRALVENDLNRTEQAISDNRRALDLFQAGHDLKEEAGVFSNLGDISYSLSRYAEALARYRQARQLYQVSGDALGSARSISNIGNVALALHQYDLAVCYYFQALPTLQTGHDQFSQAKTLNNLASAFLRKKQPAKALLFYRKALPLFRVTNQDGYGKALTNLGNIFLEGGRDAQALALYRQALPVLTQVGDWYGEGRVLTHLGDVYSDYHKPGQAMQWYQSALIANTAAGDRQGAADTLNALMEIWQSQGNKPLAIFYGKRAVAVYQQIRRDIRAGLNKNSQASFIAANADTYRSLADLLIRTGRLPEAQQVLDLLKQQELFEFLRGGSLPTGSDGQADMTPQEAAEEQEYAQIAGQVIALGRQQQALRDQAVLGTLAPDGQAQMEATRAKLTLATRHLNRFFAQEAAAFQSPTPANETLQARLQAVKNARDIQDTLRRLHAEGQDVVVLETVVAPDRTAVIITTAQGQKVEQFPIKAEDLNKKVAAFQSALRDPGADPRGPAHELYKVLVAPLEQDLQQSGARTLMWSLDGTLRYVPIAALYDGKQYLVERFENEVFTLGSQSGFGADERAKWEGLGMGVSLEHSYVDPVSKQQYHFDPLQSVPAELQAVILSADSKAGVVPGDMLLDLQFTQSTMTTALEHGKYNLVHVASHFALRPGSPDDSFLLLGDGGHLSLTQIADDATLFQGVDLLSLSACDTATGGVAGADGKEVDSLGSVAQQDGAKSILASLWPVSDDSTRLLMQGFYREHETHAGMTKAESLRQSQLSLLRGTAAQFAGTAKPGLAKRSITYAGRDISLPAYVFNPNAPYAHPFYWAPFILIGNWR